MKSKTPRHIPNSFVFDNSNVRNSMVTERDDTGNNLPKINNSLL